MPSISMLIAPAMPGKASAVSCEWGGRLLMPCKGETQMPKKLVHEIRGARVVDRLAGDLKTTFPDIKGFSVRDLMYMRKFAGVWPDEQIVPQLVAQIPVVDTVREEEGRQSDCHLFDCFLASIKEVEDARQLLSASLASGGSQS